MASVAANRNFPGGTVAMRMGGAAFVAESAIVVGEVTLGADTSVWPFTCIRGDVAPIRVGARCSIQDQAMLHTRGGEPLEIGARIVTAYRELARQHAAGRFDGAPVEGSAETGSRAGGPADPGAGR